MGVVRKWGFTHVKCLGGGFLDDVEGTKVREGKQGVDKCLAQMF